MRRTMVVGLVVAVAGLQIASTRLAQGRTCQGDNEHQCWRSLSGPNYSQVVVGNTFDSGGIACAVTSPQTTSWGGVLHCYVPLGTSGATIRGRGGEEAQNPGPFQASNPNMRIVSLAIRNYTSIITSTVTIYALRSDSQVFTATLAWPKGPNDDPRINFTIDTVPTPSNLRQIGSARFLGLLGVTTSNQLLQRTSSGWVALGSDSVALLGASGSGNSALDLIGTTGFSKTVGIPGGGPAPPLLPATLTFALSDPNNAFSVLGRTTPLSAGQTAAYALVPGNCPSGSLTPCIYTAAWTGTWGSWQSFATGDISAIPGFNMPWTIQDGTRFRGVAGEVWVIAGNETLNFWAP